MNLLMRKASKLVTAVQDSISTCVRVKTQDILKATTGQFLAIVVLTKKFFFFFSESWRRLEPCLWQSKQDLF